MHRRSFTLLVGAALLAAGCSKAAQTVEPMAAPAPAPAAVAVDPAGRWSVALVAQGQQFDFVMELNRTGEGTYAGTVTSQAFPPMAISRATLTGNRLRFSVVAPTGDDASFDLVFEKDAFTGDWAMPGDGSKVSGRRI